MSNFGQLNHSFDESDTEIELENDLESDIEYFEYTNDAFNKLKYIKLQGGDLEIEINEHLFKNLYDLEIINFSLNKISLIKENSFNYLTNLKKINFSNNNIEVIDENIFKGLIKLENIDFSKNRIKFIYNNCFEKLEELKILRFFKNKIEIDIKENLFKDLVNLKVLNFANNRIKSIEETSFKNLLNLIEINFSKNQISKFSSKTFVGLEKLQTILFNFNMIQTFIDKHMFNDLENLNFLDFSVNLISKIDSEAFVNNRKLVHMLFSNNNLTNFEIIFDNLSNLEFLKVSSNALQEFNLKIENSNENRIFKLKQINLDNNQLDSIPDFSLFNLLKIHLSGNKIKFIDSKFKNYLFNNQMLEYVNLTRNLFALNYIKQIEYQFFDLFNSNILKMQSFTNLNQPGYVQSMCVAENNENYIQLRNFKWEHIPMFAVITGKNGIGKTSILDFIDKQLNPKPDTEQNNEITLTFKDHKNFNKPGSLFFSIYDYVKSSDFFFTDFNGFNMRNIFRGNYIYIDLDDSYSYLNNEPDRYGTSILSLHSINACIDHLKDDLDRLNEYLRIENFKYEIYQFDDQSIEKTKFKSNSNQILDEKLLSPGERLILLFLLWKYVFKKHKLMRGNVLLLDEPDSHLHPTAVSEIVSIIKDLVELGIQVIITTHNPITISLINNENLFLITENKNMLQIQSSINKFKIYQHLTPSGLINVENFYKIVFIEGKTDEPFYNLIYEKLKSDGYITDDVNLIFRPLQEDFQNKRNVLNFIEKITQKRGMNNNNNINLVKNEFDYYRYRFEKIIYAIVDDDNDRYRNKRVEGYENLHYLSRYSFENYLWDPINIIFSFLNSQKLYDTKRFKLKDNFLDILAHLRNRLDEKNFIKHAQSNINSNFLMSNFLSFINEPKINILQLVIDEIETYILNECFQLENTCSINLNDKDLKSLINYINECKLNDLFRINDQKNLISELNDSKNRVEKLNQFINEKRKNSIKNFQVFKMKINFYKLFDLYENNQEKNPLNEFLDQNGYFFDPFTEYLRLKWMESYLKKLNCQLTDRFKINIDKKIKNTKIFKRLFENNSFDVIIKKLNKNHNFLKIYKSIGSINSLSKINKSLTIDIDKDTKIKMKEMLAILKKNDLIEFIYEMYDKFDLKPIISIIKFRLNEKVTIAEEVNNKLNKYAYDFSQNFKNQNDLKYFKIMVQKIFADELKSMLSSRSDLFITYFDDQFVLKYSAFFFKMRGHDLEQEVLKKIFLKQPSSNIFDLSSQKKIENVVQNFRLIGGPFITNELIEIFQKLSKKDFDIT